MAGKTSKAPTQPPGEALSPKHEAFVQAYVSRGMNGTKAYRAVYPGCKSDLLHLQDARLSLDCPVALLHSQFGARRSHKRTERNAKSTEFTPVQQPRILRCLPLR
jgi:hypothetical protein